MRIAPPPDGLRGTGLEPRGIAQAREARARTAQNLPPAETKTGYVLCSVGGLRNSHAGCFVQRVGRSHDAYQLE
jgi:hypothetical protein